MGVHEDCVDDIHKYCLTRPSAVEIIFDRIIREWFIRENEHHDFERRPALLEHLKKNIEHVPEDRTQSVHVQKDHARIYLKLCQKLGLNPVDFLTFQARTFIRVWGIKKRIELNTKRKMKEWGDPKHYRLTKIRYPND